MVHDPVITVRKFYGEAELEAIARMGAPETRIVWAEFGP